MPHFLRGFLAALRSWYRGPGRAGTATSPVTTVTEHMLFGSAGLRRPCMACKALETRGLFFFVVQELSRTQPARADGGNGVAVAVRNACHLLASCYDIILGCGILVPPEMQQRALRQYAQRLATSRLAKLLVRRVGGGGTALRGGAERKTCDECVFGPSVGWSRATWGPGERARVCVRVRVGGRAGGRAGGLAGRRVRGRRGGQVGG